MRLRSIPLPFSPPSSPASTGRRLALHALWGAAALQLPLVARAGFNFFLNEYSVSRDELQAQIVKHFPVRQRYAEIFTIGLRDPRISLDARSNRAAITALLTIGSPLLQPSTVEGIVTVSSALKYDAAARAIQLDQPNTERLELQGLTGRDAERLQRIGGLVTQELLRDYPLRSFRPDELTVGRRTYEIGEITVEADDIKVQLK